MLNIFIYQNDKFKRKTEEATQGMELDSYINEPLGLFKKVRELTLDESVHSYQVKKDETIEIISKLDIGLDKICIYYNSKIIYGSKWSRFSKQDKEDFDLAIKFMLENIRLNRRREKEKKC